MEPIPASEDISGLCRLCLKGNTEMQDVFDPPPSNYSSDSSLINKISYSTSVEITQVDELPSQICYECCEQVEKIYTYKQKCLAVDSLLRNHVRHKFRLEGGSDPVSALPCSNSTSGLQPSERNVDKGDESNQADDRIEDSVFSTSANNSHFDHTLLKIEIKTEDEHCESSGSSSADTEDSLVRKSSNKSKSRSCKYSCSHCGKSFCNKYSLGRHQWSHSKKTIACTFCSKTFTNQESWLRHERMHKGTSRYQCELCAKSYVSSTSYAAHVRKHTGERPFKCSDCDETFYLISSFERHIAKHRGVKEYQCEICAAAFWVPDDLRAHVNRMH